MAKNPVRQIYEEPWVFVWIIIFSVWLYANNTNRTAGIVLGLLSLASYIFYKEIKDSRFQINSIKGNFGHSVVLALMAIVITTIGSAIVSYFLGTLNLAQGASLSSFGAIMEFTKTAVLGAQISPFANNILITWLIFVIAFPVAETILILSSYKFVLSRFKTPVKLSNPLVWIVAFAMGGFAILYHIYAKTTMPGVPNINSLMIIWVLFTTECLITVHAKEQEPAILHHIINNAIALSFV